VWSWPWYSIQTTFQKTNENTNIWRIDVSTHVSTFVYWDILSETDEVPLCNRMTCPANPSTCQLLRMLTNKTNTFSTGITTKWRTWRMWWSSMYSIFSNKEDKKLEIWRDLETLNVQLSHHPKQERLKHLLQDLQAKELALCFYHFRRICKTLRPGELNCDLIGVQNWHPKAK
jgi:hypothetical protein